MLRVWKTAALVAPLTLALGGYAYTCTHAAPTYRLANDIQITPVEVPPDNTADVLGIKTYKFDVMMPSAAQGLALTVNSCRAGKIIQSVGGGGFRPMHGETQKSPLHLTRIMAPDDQDFSRGAKVKYLLKSTGVSVSGKFPNPLQGSKGIGYEPDGISEEQNSIYLIGGGKTGGTPVKYDDVSLALTLTPLKPL